MMGELAGLLFLLGLGLVLAVLVPAALVARESVRPSRHTAGYAVAHGLAVDPGELGLNFEEWRHDVDGSASLPVWEIDKRSGVRGQGSGALITIFLHGWGESRIDWLNRLGPFDELSDRLVLYDLRGHGEARGESSRLGHGEDRDLLELLQRLDGGRFLLVGHALGSVVAILAAAESSAVRDRIVGVVAYAPYVDFHSWLRNRLRLAGFPARPLTDLAMLGMRLAGWRFANTEVVAASMRCPLLVVVGTDDPLSPPAHGKRIAEACGAVLHAVPGGGHTDIHANSAQAVRDFVDRCVSDQPAPVASASVSGPR